VSAVVVAARFAWTFPATYLPRWLSASIARRDPAPPWQWPFAIAFTGIRGIVSLVAALAIPLTREDDSPFPHRELILFLTFAVILVTLVGQGLLLPRVMRALGLAYAGRRERIESRAEEWSARAEAARTANARLEQSIAEHNLSPDWAERIRAAYLIRIRHIEEGASDDPAVVRNVAERRALELELLAVERDRINDLYRAGRLLDEPRRSIERDLDLREARLEPPEFDD
jgi:CPA1 family monovalent cation:H+ antiporter